MADEGQPREVAMSRVFGTLGRARVGWRVVEALRGLIRTFALAGGAFVLALILDNIVHLPGAVRLAALIVLSAGTIGLLARLVGYPALRLITDQMVAARLERGLPELENRLINAVLLSGERFADPLVDSMAGRQISEASQWLGARPLPRAPEAKNLWKPARWALALAVFGGLYALLFTAHFTNAVQRFIHPRGFIQPITNTRLEVSPGDKKILQGTPLPVEARVDGVLPESARIYVRNSGGERSRALMLFEGDRFTHKFSNVQADFNYRILAGDASTRWYEVTVQKRPSIVSLKLTYRYPEYTGLAEREIDDADGDIFAPVGTSVDIVAQVDRPVARGRLEQRLGGDQKALTLSDPLVEEEETLLRGQLKVEQSGRYAILLEDSVGIENLPAWKRIEAVPDRSPTVTFLEPGRDIDAAPDGKVTLLAEAEDDFSLKEMHLLAQTAAGKDWQKLRSWQCEAGAREMREGAVLDLADLGVKEGQTVAYYMRANDGMRREEDNAGRSRIYHIRVTNGAAKTSGKDVGQALSDAEAVLQKALAGEGESKETVKAEEPAMTGKQMVEKLLYALKDFGDAQKRILEISKQLGARPVDDFTDADEQKLKEIAELERELSDFFQEAATDLSKLHPQDFSLPVQADEFLEVYSEVQQAAESLERKAVELAVPQEQAGLELAESIETNIEKWLMETKDNQLWSMEEPLEDYDVPMTELPDELQDLIGDLVESEEDMTEEFDDVTSGWMDSLDKGAGWGTMDGPISNMSAKGVTGNRLPNTQEVGGRSGEGRTGKSSGQFVEKKATGKGGRKTPSRLTPDPFEAGFAEDTSKEPATGSTGGGKVSGQGAEGFQGPVPPPLQQKLSRMAQRQRQLIDKARRINYGLEKYRAPRGRLPDTIELMKLQEDHLRKGEVSAFASYQRVVLSGLREVKELTQKQKQVARDRGALLPKRVRDELSLAQTEEAPEAWRQMVRDYFRALSEAGTPRQ